MCIVISAFSIMLNGLVHKTCQLRMFLVTTRNSKCVCIVVHVSSMYSGTPRYRAVTGGIFLAQNRHRAGT